MGRDPKIPIFSTRILRSQIPLSGPYWIPTPNSIWEWETPRSNFRMEFPFPNEISILRVCLLIIPIKLFFFFSEIAHECKKTDGRTLSHPLSNCFVIGSAYPTLSAIIKMSFSRNTDTAVAPKSYFSLNLLTYILKADWQHPCDIRIRPLITTKDPKC